MEANLRNKGWIIEGPDYRWPDNLGSTVHVSRGHVVIFVFTRFVVILVVTVW